MLEALVSLWLWLEMGNGCEVVLRLVTFSNSFGSISLAVEVSVGEFNPESELSFPLACLTAGTSVIELGLRICLLCSLTKFLNFLFQVVLT